MRLVCGIIFAGVCLGQINQGGSGGNAVSASQAGTWTVGLTAGSLLVGKFIITDGTNAATVTAGGALNVSCVSGCSGTGPSGDVAVVNSTTVGMTQLDVKSSSGIAQLPLALVSGRLDVNIGASTTVPVSGTFWQATQPVSGTFWQTTQPVSIATMPTTPVTGTFWQSTQPVSIAATVATSSTQLPATLDGSGYLKVHEQGTATVSGTVTANQGTAAALAGYWPVRVTDGTNTMPTGDASARTIHVTTDNASQAVTQSGTWTVQPGNTANTTPWLASINDGTNTAAVKAASTAAGATDKALVVAVSPNNSVTVAQATAASLNATVTGTVNAAQSGTWTVQPGNTANTTAWKVDGSAVTQPTNVSQINGVTPLMGNGTTGTGSQRVTIASDNTAFTVNAAQSGTWTVQPGNTANTTPWLITDSATSATGSAVPAKAGYIGGNSSGNLTGIIACDNHAVLEMSTATTTQIIAASGSTKIYICSYAVQAGGTTTATMKYGTGSNCGTGTGALGAAFELTAQTGVARGSGLGMIAKTIASQAVCWTNSAAVNLHVEVTYTQF